MKFDKNIYHLDWRRLVRMLLPVNMRKARMIALSEAANSSLIWLYAQFLNFKLAVEYQLTITPQVCYLQRLLNDRFDFTLRRITIVDAPTYHAILLSIQIESKQLLLPLQGEENPIALPLRSEVAQYSSDFIIRMPNDVVYDIHELSAVLSKYKLSTKKFHINTIDT